MVGDGTVAVAYRVPMPIRKTRTRLSDGRELIYFDDTEPYASGVVTRELHDGRDLAPVEAASTMRFDVLTGEWVTLAAHRMNRTFLPATDECPLCPTRPGRPATEIPAGDYDVAVFENRFPSLGSAAEEVPGLVDGERLWPQHTADGRCEVVCFTRDHDRGFAQLPVSRVRTVLEALRDRTRELSTLPSVAQVYCFENRGEEIGVTLSHPHGQIYAYPTLPPRTTALLRQAEEHRKRTGRSLLRDVLDAERRAGTRVVVEGEHWTAYVPAAARWPVELHVAPHRDVADLTELDDAELDELSHLYLDVLGRLDRFFDGVDRLPYIAGWHQAPIGAGRDLGRLHLQVFSLMRSPHRMKFLAGSESGMGAWISDTTPERIAARFREVAP
ncbi:galactose-1-phosphate uridylyltransferase [Rhodococcus hoagii]|uniref:Galactose-1-phosphate uridylyltransferase n=2 Tax=Prescottella TaxID=2979332 RepID=A0AAE5CIQ3_RHOHA|nr:galactose-1-phosphate uridylyltransferase [Prescottella equi]NKS29092.1 galactose-1-phosphate uridylyltransferase [Prescottella equi]NKS84188.1 galactose-1-phosphate uridylyltransferase [Prescottella equi]